MKRFYRVVPSYFGGVCEGLGRYFDIDPIVFRLIFVLGLFVSCFSLIIYLVIWLFTDEVDFGQPSF